jgi:hypothetical protein
MHPATLWQPQSSGAAADDGGAGASTGAKKEARKRLAGFHGLLILKKAPGSMSAPGA